MKTSKTKDKQPPNPLLDLDDSLIEPLILKQCIIGSRISHLVYDSFDSRIFTNNKIQLLVSAFKNYYSKYQKVPSNDLQEIIVKGIAKKFDIPEASIIAEWQSAKNINIENDDQFIEATVLDFVKGKLTYLTIMDNLDNIKVNKDVSACMKTFNDIIAITLDRSIGFDYFNDLDEHFNEITNPESLMPTGFSELDKAFNGGIPKSGKCLVVFMGQTNIGKSLILSNLAVNMLMQNKFVVVFSMEMCERVYSTRISAHISSDNINNLINTADSSKFKIKAFNEKYPEAKLLIKEFPPKTVTPATISTTIEKIINKYNRKPDIILIDYINILNPVDKSAWGNSYDKIGAVTVELRALSYKFEAPVVSVTQSNRSGYNNSSINIDSVSDSLQIGTTADAMVSLWQQEGDREENRINATVIKSRFGQVGFGFPLNIDYQSLRVSDYTDTYEDQSSTDYSSELNEIIM